MRPICEMLATSAKILLVGILLGLVLKITTQYSISKSLPLDRQQEIVSPDPIIENPLAKSQSQQSKLVALIAECKKQITQSHQTMAIAPEDGALDVPCSSEQELPQWIAREAFLVERTYRLQTVETSVSTRKIDGVPSTEWTH